MPAVFALTAGLCLLVAVISVDAIEARTGTAVRHALAEKGLDWAEARADGTLIHLGGTAPDEPARFHALSAASSVVDSARLIDDMEVTAPEPIEAPRFSVELLRNQSGISVIGLIPAETRNVGLAEELAEVARAIPLTDMLQTADYPAPKGWNAAVAFGLDAVELLKRAKISITADRVAVTAVSDSKEEKAEIERKLTEAAPDGLTLALDISAPRPIIAPFTLRFLMDRDGARFDACAADTEEAAAEILAAASRAGMVVKSDCMLALGVPSPKWGAAVARSIDALAALGGGSLTLSDADVTLVAQPGTAEQTFDEVTGALKADLPDAFALHAVLPDPVTLDGSGTANGPREFVATLSPEGLLQLRGRVPDAMVREAAESYARAHFGKSRMHTALRIDPSLPEGWPLRVFSGLEALAQLRNGAVIVQAGYIQLTGLTMDDSVKARVTRMLSGRLGAAQNYRIDITYREPPASEIAKHGGRPSPEACVAEIGDILDKEKITFAPGSTEIEGSTVRVVDQIADVLRSCPDAKIEIGGYTDSQGRESMNLQLSQKRADAVLRALMARRVLVGNITSKGYGESQPIADNGTEEGREANRRIEFRLIEPEGGAEDAADGPEDATAEPADDEAPEAEAGEDSAAEATPAEETGAEAGADPAAPEAEAEDTTVPPEEEGPSDGQD